MTLFFSFLSKFRSSRHVRQLRLNARQIKERQKKARESEYVAKELKDKKRGGGGEKNREREKRNGRPRKIWSLFTHVCHSSGRLKMGVPADLTGAQRGHVPFYVKRTRKRKKKREKGIEDRARRRTARSFPC